MRAWQETEGEALAADTEQCPGVSDADPLVLEVAGPATRIRALATYERDDE
jgi:hypothetical protein